MSEGKQLKPSDFTGEMHEKARAEGWRLSERSDGYLGIEREDEAERFKTDVDAHEFVADQARLHGSYMHQVALHLDGKPYRRGVSPKSLSTTDMRVSIREFNTVLAALRFWQRVGNTSDLPEYSIANDTGEDSENDDALSDDEIDTLCERLNCG